MLLEPRFQGRCDLLRTRVSFVPDQVDSHLAESGTQLTADVDDRSVVERLGPEKVERRGEVACHFRVPATKTVRFVEHHPHCCPHLLNRLRSGLFGSPPMKTDRLPVKSKTVSSVSATEQPLVDELLKFALVVRNLVGPSGSVAVPMQDRGRSSERLALDP